MKLARIDVAGESLDPSSSGTVSLIQDTDVGLTYAIHRQYSNCTISPLASGFDLYLALDGHYHLRSVSDIFLLSALNYSYAGNMSAHGVMLDNWRFSGDFCHAGYNYTNTTLVWSITQPGQAISTLSSISTSPTLWRYSVEGSVYPLSLNKSMTMNISSVSRFFDLVFDEPSFDAFDTSICVDPMDASFLTLAVPGARDGTDLSQLRGNIRKAVSNYTQIYPTQVGNVQVGKHCMRVFINCVTFSNN